MFYIPTPWAISWKLVISLLVSLSLFGCSQNQLPLRIGTNIWPGYEPLYLAREQGLLNGHQIHLVEYTSASQVLDAFRNGIIGSAALTLDEVLTLQAEGLEPKIVVVLDISTGGDAILAQPGIKNFRQLRGKRVGVENTALGAYFLSRALQLNGMSEKDINIVPIELHQHVPYFRNQLVDAVVSFDPARAHLLQLGAKILFDSSMIANEIVDVLVINNKIYNDHQQQLDVLIDAWYQSIEQVKTNDAKALAIINRRLQLDQASLLKAYDGLMLPDRKLNSRLIHGKQPALRSTVDLLAHTMQTNKLLSGPVNPASLFIDIHGK